MGTPRRRVLAAGVVAGLALIVPATTAAAATKTTKPAVAGYAWYWEDQHQQTVPNPDGGGDAATLELPNPFCPGPPGNIGSPEPTCKSGRLPVEVRGGDYKSPSMISTLSFDVTAAPLGSKVKKFTVVLKEADDEQSKPINVEGHKVQACLVKEFFGDGEARRYKEAPKFTCSKSDPLGVRKKVKPKKKGGDPTFEWTFDLTEYAKTWVGKGSPATAVMFVPAKPKNAGPSDNNWRVVFTGSVKPQEHGVRTTLVYEPAALGAPLGGLDFSTVGGSGSGSSGGFGSTSGGSTFTDSSGSSPAAPSSAPATGRAAPAADDATAPAKANDKALAAAETDRVPAPIGMPWYMWLGILGGIVGFSLVRNFVLESATGIRPNGVLAQIQQINARRRGTTVTAAAAGGASPLTGLRTAITTAGAGLTKLGGKARHLVGKLSMGRR